MQIIISSCSLLLLGFVSPKTRKWFETLITSLTDVTCTLFSWSTPRRNTEGCHSRSRVYSLSLWWWVLFKWLPLSILDLLITVLLCQLVWYYLLLLSCKNRLLSSQPMLNFCFCDDKTVRRISNLASLMGCQSVGGWCSVFLYHPKMSVNWMNSGFHISCKAGCQQGIPMSHLLNAPTKPL